MTKILIVDDIDENRYLLKNYLESDGYIVIEAKNGIEALEILKNNEVHLIISDILMPQMDGFSLCRAIKQDKDLKTIPFVFYTATYTDEQDEKLALSLGASRFILKPKEKEEFNKIITEVMTQFTLGEIKIEQIENKDQTNYFKMYNEVLIRKLENKMIQLEESNLNLNQKIAENEKIYKELDSNLKYFTSVIDELDDPLIIIDKNYMINEVNKKFCQIFGEKSEIISNSFFKIKDEFFKNTNLQFLFDDFEVENFAVNKYEIEIEIGGLEKKVYSVKARKIKSKNNKEYDILILFEDVTEYKKILKEKEQIYNQLIQIERIDSIGNFASGISHDFNNILTVIINSSQIILDSINKENSFYEDAKNINDAAIRGSELTKKILLFSRKKEIKPEVIDIHDEIKDFYKIAKRLISENISVEYKLNAVETKVLIDPINFQQILINLFSNSKDAMPNGGTINVKTQNKEYLFDENEDILPGKYLKLEISDTGNGIEKQMISHIFEPFFTTKKVGEGTGLGLYLVSSIVKQINGYIYVCSELGKGTTFIILLPIALEFSEKQIETFDEAKIMLKVKNILLVEDEPFVIAAIEKILLKMNSIVKKAKNGKEAIELVEKGFIPDLVISDIILEDISGDSLTRILKKKVEKLKVLYMSGYNKDELIKRNIMINNLNFIQKPFTIRELQDKIYKLMLN